MTTTPLLLRSFLRLRAPVGAATLTSFSLVTTFATVSFGADRMATAADVVVAEGPRLAPPADELDSRLVEPSEEQGGARPSVAHRDLPVAVKGADPQITEAMESALGAAAGGDVQRSPLSLPSGANKSGVSSTAISAPDGAGTIEGLGESFSAQMSTGTASYSVPLAVPRGRGVQPSLALSYSSGNGADIAGHGWSLGAPFIARQTDRGTPLYDDRPHGSWHPNQDRFTFNGGQELVPICDVGNGLECETLSGTDAAPGETMPSWAAGWQYQRARVEGGFLRFFWSPDRRTWRVQSKGAETMEFGMPLDGAERVDALEVNPADDSEIYRWCLSRKYDSYGYTDRTDPRPNNFVNYFYDRYDGSPLAYLGHIYYTSNPGRGYAHHVRLRYEERSDPSFSFRSGFRLDQTRRLKYVEASSLEDGSNERELVRR